MFQGKFGDFGEDLGKTWGFWRNVGILAEVWKFEGKSGDFRGKFEDFGEIWGFSEKLGKAEGFFQG